MKISFKVDGELQSLETVLKYFDQLDRAGIARKDWLQCQLALAEGFTNAVRHAHKNLPPEIPIEIEIELTPDGMDLRIFDHGPSFDLEKYLRENLAPDALRSGRGQGIPILRKIATHLAYQRTPDDRNCLSIVKSFTPPAGR
ncbi:ATP-binding protein [Pannus brasiliensis CCIBt3594]|uniref:ATP-binding protein n=1 Tax=Pannus brasiliensis CCIBt3594 TaxID=1427578 RepID=A0AAW9R0A1_9CHRO